MNGNTGRNGNGKNGNGRSPGQPTKLNEEVKKQFLTAISLGVTYQHACDAVGIHYSTFCNWRIRGEEQKSGQYVEFVEDIKRAKATGIASSLARIAKASKEVNHWQAAAWLLERRYPEIYGRNIHEHQVKGEIEVTHKEESRDRLKGILSKRFELVDENSN